VAIVDEFDSILFSCDNGLEEASRILPNLKKMIGFTGSELKDFHIKAAEKVIGGNLVRLNIANVFKPLGVCHGVDVYSKISDYRDVIVTLCEQ
jgi:hypothetical protein